MELAQMEQRLKQEVPGVEDSLEPVELAVVVTLAAAAAAEVEQGVLEWEMAFLQASAVMAAMEEEQLRELQMVAREDSLMPPLMAAMEVLIPEAAEVLYPALQEHWWDGRSERWRRRWR